MFRKPLLYTTSFGMVLFVFEWLSAVLWEHLSGVKLAHSPLFVWIQEYRRERVFVNPKGLLDPRWELKTVT